MAYQFNECAFACIHVPSLVLKVRHLGGSTFCNVYMYMLGMPAQALRRSPLGFGIVLKDKPSEFSCTSFVFVQSSKAHTGILTSSKCELKFTRTFPSQSVGSEGETR